ncbi:MAG: DUF3343 domain-containing protein [Oscillospiraceae bacterium]|nr:DUF3343 domain-containing protein [Oscillospiraceae bacterium]MDD6527198.1 DUF3343 domain-containing protein [Oscillospiraceae bacterium]
MTYIKFANQTFAQKAASLLNKRGFKTRIRRNPNPNHKEGCNYALFVSGDIFEAYDIISENFIPTFGVEHLGDEA